MRVYARCNFVKLLLGLSKEEQNKQFSTLKEHFEAQLIDENNPSWTWNTENILFS